MFEESASNRSIWASMNSWFTPTVLFVLLNLMIGTILFSSSLSNQDHQQQQQQQQQHEQKQEQADSHQNEPQQPKLGRSPSVLQRLKSINLYNFRSQESPPISSLSKQTLDSDAHYSSQQANQLQQTIESHTHYIFEETHHHETIITDTQFHFEQTHEEKPSKTQSQFDFEQTHEAKSPEMQTPYVAEETHGDEEEDGEPQSLDEVYSQLAQLNDRHVSRTTSDTKPASGEVPAKLPQKMKKSASMKSAFGHFEESDIVENCRPASVRERRSAKATEDDDEVDAKADDFINKFKQQLKLQRLDSIIRYKELKEAIGRGSTK